MLGKPNALPHQGPGQLRRPWDGVVRSGCRRLRSSTGPAGRGWDESFHQGQVLIEVSQRVEPVKLAELAAAIGTDTAGETARLVPFFGPTVAGERLLVDLLGLDLPRALLAGQSYEWSRPLEPGETVEIRVFVEDVHEKGSSTIGVVATDVRDEVGEFVQQQRTTFIERSGK